VRVGLLEVVERTLGGVLTQLPQLTLVAEVVGESRAVHRFDQNLVERLVGTVRPVLGVPAQRVQEAALQIRPQPEQCRLPLPGGVHALESAVVQLITEVERQVQVLAVGIGLVNRGVHRQGALGARTAPQRPEGSAAEFAAARGQKGLVQPDIGGLRRFHSWDSSLVSLGPRVWSESPPGAAEPLALWRWLVSHQG
jgi:hypothetical protein